MTAPAAAAPVRGRHGWSPNQSSRPPPRVLDEALRASDGGGGDGAPRVRRMCTLPVGAAAR